MSKWGRPQGKPRSHCLALESSPEELEEAAVERDVWGLPAQAAVRMTRLWNKQQIMNEWIKSCTSTYIY